jgi:hypothetical protein
MKYRSYIEALKSADVPSYVRKLAWNLGLDVTVNVEKGIFRETTFFSVDGSDDDVYTFKKRLYRALENYNN